jgi:hypothetical protein
MLRSLCIAVLLFALPGSAEGQTAEETTGSQAVIEAATGEAEKAAEGGAEAEDAVGRAAEDDAADALGEGEFSVEDLEDLEQPLVPELPEGIEEIKVTSERGMGTPQDAPISTIGFDADVILKEGIKDIRDLSNFTPSLEIKSAFAASNPTIFIRGVRPAGCALPQRLGGCDPGAVAQAHGRVRILRHGHRRELSARGADQRDQRPHRSGSRLGASLGNLERSRRRHQESLRSRGGLPLPV